MPYSLKARNVLVIGGSRGLGAVISEKFAAEGSNVAINYMSNKQTADEVAKDLASKYNVKTVVIQGDAGKQESAASTVKSSIEQLGGLDVIISNAGWTKITNFPDLDAMDDEDWDKCWNINVKSSLYLFKAAKSTFDANPEGGAFLITASTAGVTPSGSAVPYSVAKAAAIHLMKCLAQSQGAKVRVNSVLPSLMLTEWGQKFPQEKIDAMREKMVLKKLPEVEDVADMFIAIAKNSSMTGQAVQIDCGFAIR
ncbi:hypothetical protein N7493_009557 [Penicillium malachiteum]|uniref:Uncharacterized protein n=1 Tax=Penicillium malachiteum TaxID=1324776 RepID=A0AAD6HEJ2_9EURO|nr:hypothetical protein N7493_009557 [Penicillium malachiteum]